MPRLGVERRDELVGTPRPRARSCPARAKQSAFLDGRRIIDRGDRGACPKLSCEATDWQKTARLLDHRQQVYTRETSATPMPPSPRDSSAARLRARAGVLPTPPGPVTVTTRRVGEQPEATPSRRPRLADRPVAPDGCASCREVNRVAGPASGLAGPAVSAISCSERRRCRTRVESGLVDELAPEGRAGGHRIGRTPFGGQSPHEQEDAALAQRLGRDHRGRLGHRRGAPRKTSASVRSSRSRSLSSSRPAALLSSRVDVSRNSSSASPRHRSSASRASVATSSGVAPFSSEAS